MLKAAANKKKSKKKSTVSKKSVKPVANKSSNSGGKSHQKAAAKSASAGNQKSTKSIKKDSLKKTPGQFELDINRVPLLRAAILFFIHKIPDRLHRVNLCKHLYYADGHFFQKYNRIITENEYLHIEGSPMPKYFNEVMHLMVAGGDLQVVPQVVQQDSPDGPIMVLKGMTYKAIAPIPDVFSREEMKVLNSIALLFKGDLSLETRYYPNLYQFYAQTGLYETIQLFPLPDGIRPHLSWKAWAGKVFRLMWQ